MSQTHHLVVVGVAAAVVAFVVAVGPSKLCICLALLQCRW